MASSEDNSSQNVFEQILARLANRKSFSPQNSHFFITVRENFKKGTDRDKNHSRSMVYQRYEKQQPFNRNLYSLRKGHNSDDAFNETFVTIKNARYHIGKPKNYQVQHLEFPSFGKKSPNKNRLPPPLIENNQLSISNDFSISNRSKMNDVAQLKMSWNKYMNITGFKRSHQKKQPIQQNENEYLNGIMGKQNEDRGMFRIRSHFKRDQTQEQIQGWKNISYHEEEMIIRR